MPQAEPVHRHLDAPATVESLDLVHALLDEVWRAAPTVTQEDRIAFTTAVAEVVANVVAHAAAGLDVELHLDVDVSTATIEADVLDPGRPFDGASDGPDHDDPFADHGRGLAIARALADVGYERADGHNRWHLTRSRAVA